MRNVKGVWVAIALPVALVVMTFTASAHRLPEQRVVMVEAQDDSLSVMVAWSAPVGPQEEAFEAEAAYRALTLGPNARALDALQARLATRALAGLSLALDGRPWKPDSVELKLTEDPPGSGRRVIVALLTGAIGPGTHTAKVMQNQVSISTRIISIATRAKRATFSSPYPGSAEVVMFWRG